MTPVSIEEAGPDDLEAVLGLYRHLHRHDPPPADAVAREIWTQTLADPNLHLLVARREGEVVSTCILVTVPNLTRGARPYGLIENVVTHPDHQRQGFGTQVMRRALEIAWSKRCYKVMLMTSRQEEATLRFYDSVGFSRKDKTAFVVRAPEG